MKLLRLGIISFCCRPHFVSVIPHLYCMAVFTTVVYFGQISATEAAANEQVKTIAAQATATVGGNPLTEFDALTAKAQAQGQVPVLLRLNVNFQAEGVLPGPARVTQRSAITNAQNVVVQSLAGRNPTNIKTYRFVPYMALTVNAVALQALAKNPMVTGIIEDVPAPPTLAESTAVIGANAAWAAGYDGSGWAVAVLDTGVDKNHNFLSGKVISEACYSTTNHFPITSTSLCPGGVASSTATDSGLNCPVTTKGCQHGTHVSGIVAGSDYTPNGPGYNGVARGANVIAIQVFSQFTGSDCTNNGLSSPCALSYTSDQITGLERVYALRTSFNIAAVNMSLGGGQNFANCDRDPRKTIIDNLRAAGIATVIASGNNGYKTAMGAPACISTAISVGATCDSATAGFGCTAVDDVPGYSNIAPFISLLAPGSLISSSVPGTNTFASWHGTSMATPHIAGAWAVMKQRAPGATVTEILDALQNTGTLVDDQRTSGSVTGMRRINIDNALGVFAGDSDGDGISDANELILGTNPNSVDSDGDGLVDGADGVVPLSAYPGGIDLDGDGFVDGEQDLGTDPTTSNIGDVAPRGSPDNEINLGDVVVLTRLVAGAIPPTALEARLGDINNDGQLNVADVLLLQQAVLNGTAP